MRLDKPTLATCLAVVALTCVASLHAAIRDKLLRFNAVPHSLSALERDELLLATDMQQLRGDLRHHAGQTRIAIERATIRRDWNYIVVGRSLEGDRYSPTLVSIRPNRWLGSRGKPTNADAKKIL